MLGIIWRIGDIAKNIENTMDFNDLSRFEGSKSASFSYIFGVPVSRSFFDRLGFGFGVDLGAVWAPKWGPCWGDFLGLGWKSAKRTPAAAGALFSRVHGVKFGSFWATLSSTFSEVAFGGSLDRFLLILGSKWAPKGTSLAPLWVPNWVQISSLFFDEF